MRQKTYVVTGASGHVGQAVVESLHARGHRTREVSRRAGVSIDDAGALTRAFSEADGAFVMIPFDMKARDLHEREQEMGMRLAAAVRAGGVPRVVLLSGTSAHLGRNAGSGLGAAMMEERLNDLGIAELVCLRGCFFMENFLNLGIVEQAKIGVFGTMFRGDVATPMVAARDVGARAAALLTGVPFHEPRVREILGARDYTMAEATKILGSAIGHPELTYVQVSYDDARRHMLGGGLSPSFIDAVVETARSFNAGMIWAREERSAANTTETTLERWARDAFGDDEVDAGRRQGRGVDGGGCARPIARDVDFEPAGRLESERRDATSAGGEEVTMTTTLDSPRIVSREEWLEARRALLTREKELTRLRDRLAAERRALPWVQVEKPYVFDGPQGPVTLADLFDGRSQLFIKHFMMAPGQVSQCVGCSLEVDHLDGVLVHLQNHDLSYAVVARAPIEEIEAVRQRMGWRFPWVSSYRSDFNYDFHVSFRPDELAAGRAFYNYEYGNPGLEDRSGDSVFVRDEAGRIFHTYSTYGRGGEEFLGIYRYLDATPKGRGEDGPYHTLADWVRPKNMYGQGGLVEVTGRYHQAACACGAHQAAAR